MPGRRAGFSVGNMRRDQARSYGRLRAAAEKQRSLSRMLVACNDELNDAIGEAADRGIPHAAIGELTGYSEGRIWQLVNNWKPTRGKGKK